tara:strand:- start:11062 stop:12606 length:1545 start_codon:yes stop_codon:yes gene_type:complete
VKRKKLLNINNLSVFLKNSTLIKSASFELFRGDSVGLLGDSGVGKSVFSLFLLGLLNPSVFSISANNASFFLDDFSFDFLTKRKKTWDFFRANYISLIFQDPSSSLNPTICCGQQVLEVFHKTKNPPKNKKNAVIDLFKEVGFNDCEKVFFSYPHELSGGQKQRVVIAIALASNPSLIIADEPTTSLDPYAQKKILDLLLRIKKTRSIGVILISHNIELVKYFCDYIYVFSDYSFFKKESDIYKNYFFNRSVFFKKILNKNYIPLSHYKNITTNKKNTVKEICFSFKNLKFTYLKKNISFLALNNISFLFNTYDILGVVGGSGSGKTTLGRIVSGIEKNFVCDSFFSLYNINTSSHMVYQDAFSSFNPKFTVGESVLEICKLYKSNFSVSFLFKLVELNDSFIKKYPHELSGGEKQRISIARVLASNPKIIVFDESLSALDTENQYSILNLIRALNKKLNITIVFISHDIFSVSFLCNKIIVLDNGKIVDNFKKEDIFNKNRSSFTKKLISDSF